MSDKSKRFVISLNGDIEPMVERIQLQMQEKMPEHLKSLRIGKSLAVETAIKEYYARMEEA